MNNDKDKNYPVSEEELEKLLAIEYLMRGRKRSTRLKDFLKSKQPIDTLDRDKILTELREFFDETGLMVSVEQDQLEDLADTISYFIPNQVAPEKIRKIVNKAIDNLLEDQSIWTDEKKVLQATHLKDVEWYVFITELVEIISQLYMPSNQDSKGDKK